MIRTQVQFTEEQMKKLKALAHREHISIAELVRKGVDSVLMNASLIDHSEKIARAVAACGQFHSDRKDISSRHDDYLSEAFKA